MVSEHLNNQIHPGLYRFSLAEADLHQSVQFGFLGMAAGNVFGQVHSILMPILEGGNCLSSEVKDVGGMPLVENS